MSPRFKLLSTLQFTLQKVFKRKPPKTVPVAETDIPVPKELDAGAFLKEEPKPTSLPKEQIRLVDVKEKTTAEIESLAYESEEQLCAITERERDASVTSRLSKECEKIVKDGRVVLTSSTGLSVSLAKSKKFNDETCILQQKQKKDSPMPQGTVPPGTAGTPSGGDISGPTKSSSMRPVRRAQPGEVLFACLPVEWWLYFVPKTGYTGLGTFLFTFGTYLLSKEKYVLEHNYYGGLSMAIVCWGAVTYVGPEVAKMLDKEVEDYEAGWSKSRKDKAKILDQQIEDEVFHQYQADGQLMLVAAKRENVALQLEDEFRKRQVQVHKEVLKRLNYHVAVSLVNKRIMHKNLVQWVQKEVLAALSPELHDKIINMSIDNMIRELERNKPKDG
ncbi:unnamed protein product [Callosobruchus maculatus]|uniref:ATP synthase subunit b n=1 Tax=Callosobruchus maculatus TaxID=64391 RepID=A0A653CLL4_CALMS|nr:unnamed protein product [Callosobruchus maculatus]